MQAIVFASLGLGLVTGLLAGLFGIGGGLVIVPVLVFLFSAHDFPPNALMIMAIATSLAAIILTAISSIYSHHHLGSVVWRKVFRLAPGIMLGAGLGALIADQIQTEMLKMIFVVFLLYVGIEMARGAQPKPNTVTPGKLLDFCVALVIGLISALVGIGGGTLTVPYLTKTHYPMRNAVAIASACGLPIALAGTASYALLGMKAARLPEFSLGYVYLPSFLAIGFSSLFTAPIGARLTHKLPAKKLKRYFSILIFIMAIKLMWN